MTIEFIVGSPPWGWADVWCGLAAFFLTAWAAWAYLDNESPGRGEPREKVREALEQYESLLARGFDDAATAHLQRVTHDAP